jgi:4-hydroxy-3-polyprenylbenzoate decarboxylase
MTSFDLRDWLVQVDKLGELRHIEGAHVDDDIGAIVEISERSMTGPAVLFSGIQNFDPTRRILSNPISSLNRVALTVGFPTGLTKADYCDLWREKTRTLRPIPPRIVNDGPVLENVQADDDVDLSGFPAPIWHKHDGGRYIGTGCVVITKDPDGDWVNLGTYRVMVVDDKHVTIYAAPGKHLSIVRDKLFEEGKSMPVAISLGHHPAILIGGSTPLAYGSSEYDYVGGLKGEPVEVLSGDYTGLPIPAYSEFLLEGEISPTEKHSEAPFGEWPGYYASGVRSEFVTKIHRIYYRNSPIMVGTPPIKPPTGIGTAMGTIRAARLREEIRMAGVPEVKHVWFHEFGSRFFLAVSIKQRYAGHAAQVGHIATMCQGAAYMGRYVVIVDDDIDVYNTMEVMWAVATRSDPVRDINIIPRAWSDELDPMVAPGNSDAPFNSRAIIDATWPWEWRGKIPKVIELTKEEREKALAKWGDVIFSPNSNK